MEQKNRQLIALSIIALIMVALFTSFGRSLFATDTPSVTLPVPGQTEDSSSASGTDPGNQRHPRVAVTVETVQSVIAALQRTDSYYRELTVELFWTGGSSSTTVYVWQEGDWTKTQRTLPSGLVRYDLVGPELSYYWYGSERSWLSAPVDNDSADLAQQIPTYETVLALDPSAILSAGYEDREQTPCIFVEAEGALPGYLQRFWISTDSGLLVAAETEQTGTLGYRLSAWSAIQTPCPSGAVFALPDGTQVMKG